MEINNIDLLNIKSSAFNYVKSEYSSKKRFYHNLNHINSMIMRLDFEKENLNLNNNEYLSIYLAIVFHDVKYDTFIDDKLNVEYSAREFYLWFCDNNFLIKNNIIFETTFNLILSTINHQPNNWIEINKKEMLCNIFLDLDLMILASDESNYLEYTKNIRKEYSQYTDKEFKSGRLKVINGLLNKPIIFYIFRNLNESAKYNLKKEKTLIGINMEKS